MPAIEQKGRKLALDVVIVVVGATLQLLAAHFGETVGQGFVRGAASVLGGLSVIYLGVLFLLSYFFPDATYLLRLLRYVCEEFTQGGRGRHMAFFYFALGLLFGSWLVLFGLGFV